MHRSQQHPHYRLRRHSRALLGLAAVAALAGCRGDLPTSQTAAPAARAQEATAQQVARGLALALASPEARTAVRDAMRASRWDEHKIVLGEFIGTAEGAALLSAAARGRGVTPQVIQNELAGLPELDFYMPVREHRRTWTGDANLVVVAAWEGEGNAPGYAPDGRVLSVSRQSAKGMPPILFIQPAEWKGLRVRPQADTRGRVIEELGDGLGSEVFIWHSGKGDSTVVDMALPDAEAKMAALRARIAAEIGGTVSPKMMEICEPTMFYCEEPPPPPPSGPRDTTRVATFLHFMCDHTWCYEAGEYRFDAHLRPAPLVLADAYGSYYRAGLNDSVVYTLNAPIIFRRIVQNTTDWMDVHITEEDRGDFLGFNLDDDCGTVRLTWQSNAVTQYYRNNFPGNNADCHGLWWDKSYAIEVKYQWTPTFSY